jgi:hypothetical protein
MRTSRAIALLAPLLLLATAPAPPRAAESEVVTDIRLGEAPPLPEKPNQGIVHAVEQFLAARQDASIDRSLAPRAHAHLTAKVDDSVLLGPEGAELAAFDFHDDAIQPLGSGRYRVTAYLLFADDVGQVVESRDETLVFASHEGTGVTCTELKATNVILWDQQGIADAAKTMGAALELERANRYLREGSKGGDRLLAYSVADVTRDPGGKTLIQCLRFTSRAGKRGFEVSASPLVLTRTADSIRVESN